MVERQHLDAVRVAVEPTQSLALPIVDVPAHWRPPSDRLNDLSAFPVHRDHCPRPKGVQPGDGREQHYPVVRNGRGLALNNLLDPPGLGDEDRP